MNPTSGTTSTRGHEIGFYCALSAVTTVFAVWAIGMLGRSWQIPVFYKSDGLFFGAAVKGTLENGWYETNPRLGAPFSSVLHDFPQPDNTQYIFAMAMDLVTDDWGLAYNVVYLLTFPLAAMTGAWFFRLVGASRTSAFGFGILFAFTPYHFIHGQPHLALSQYFPLPLAIGLVYLSLTGRPIWDRRAYGGTFNPLTWVTRRSLATVAILVLLGTTLSYYTLFVLIFLGVTMVVHALRREGRALVGSIVAALLLAGTLLANMAPDLYYGWTRSNNVLGFERLDVESEIYALKFAALVFPTHWSRIDSWADFRATYNATFPLPGENPALGLIAAAGFVFLLVILPLLTLLVRATPATQTASFWQSQRVLSGLTVVAFLFGTVGGFGTVFAVLVTPNIRAWNRIAIVIALLALASVSLWLDRLVLILTKRWGDRGPRRLRAWALAVPCALVVAVGLWDGVAPPTWGLNGTEEQEWASDASYGAAVEDLVPDGGMVVEFPYLPYPESPPIYEMNDYDPLRGYLHTSDVRWTYGGVKGVPRSSWTERLAELPTPRMLVEASAAGAQGIHVDRYGYPGRDSSAFEASLASELGEAATVSPDGRFAFYDMTRFNRAVEQRYEPEALRLIGRRTLYQPELFWQDDFAPPADEAGVPTMRGLTASPELLVDNPVGDAVPMTMSFTVRPEGATEVVTPVTITWPDGRTDEVEVPVTGAPVTRTLLVPPGRSTLGLSGGSVQSLTLLDLTTEDAQLLGALGEPRRTAIGSSGAR